MDVSFYLTIHLGKFNTIHQSEVAVKNNRDAARGTECAFGARKDLDNYSEKNYTFVKTLYSGVRSLYDFWKADNKF